jgi:hypothetical protein
MTEEKLRKLLDRTAEFHVVLHRGTFRTKKAEASFQGITLISTIAANNYWWIGGDLDEHV